MIQTIHQPHDKLFKSSMEDIRVARDFFQSHLSPDILKTVDLKTLLLQNNTHGESVIFTALSTHRFVSNQ